MPGMGAQRLAGPQWAADHLAGQLHPGPALAAERRGRKPSAANTPDGEGLLEARAELNPR